MKKLSLAAALLCFISLLAVPLNVNAYGSPPLTNNIDENYILSLDAPDTWTIDGNECYLNGADLYMYDGSVWDDKAGYYKKYGIGGGSGWLDWGVYMITTDTFPFKDYTTYEFFWVVTYSCFDADYEYETDAISIEGEFIKPLPEGNPPVMADFGGTLILRLIEPVNKWIIDGKLCAVSDISLYIYDDSKVDVVTGYYKKHFVTDSSGLNISPGFIKYQITSQTYPFYRDGQYYFVFSVTYSDGTVSRTYDSNELFVLGSATDATEFRPPSNEEPPSGSTDTDPPPSDETPAPEDERTVLQRAAEFLGTTEKTIKDIAVTIGIVLAAVIGVAVIVFAVIAFVKWLRKKPR